MPEDPKDNPLLKPDHELPVPHDMLLTPAKATAGILTPEAKDGQLPMSHYQKLPKAMPMEHYNLKNWLIILFALMFFSLLGLTIIKSAHAPTKNAQSVTPTTDTIISPTSRPEIDITYTNEQLGFRFSYPSNWNIRESTNQTTDTHGVFDITRSTVKQSIGYLYYYNNPNSLSLEQFAAKQKQSQNSQALPVYMADDKEHENNHDVTLFHRKKANCESLGCEAYIWEKDKKIFVFLHFLGKTEDDKNTFEDVIESLEFLDEKDTMTKDLNPTVYPDIVPLTKSNLAARLKVASDTITVSSFEETTWSDGSLGCPQPGMQYTQAVVPGYRIVFLHKEKQYFYHTDTHIKIVYCEKEPSVMQY